MLLDTGSPEPVPSHVGTGIHPPSIGNRSSLIVVQIRHIGWVEARINPVAIDHLDVDTLVLTHYLPYRDQEACKAAASSVFDGTMIVVSDGLRLSSISH